MLAQLLSMLQHGLPESIRNNICIVVSVHLGSSLFNHNYSYYRKRYNAMVLLSITDKKCEDTRNICYVAFV